jgi:DNA repair protein RadC
MNTSRSSTVCTHSSWRIGSLDRSLVHPREVFRPAIKDAAKAVIVVHNHPSDDPTPSGDDFTVTSRLEEAGKTLGIEVLDHIVVARNGAVSIRECGIEKGQADRVS